MKKLICCILLAFSLISFQQANAQKSKFYYYPSSNVYYDVVNKHYIYPNNGNWQTVRVLPSGIRVSNTPRYVVYNTNRNIWVNNSVHVTKYKNHPNGRAVGYKRNHHYKKHGRGKH